MAEQEKQTIASKVPVDVVERLDALAEKLDWTRSELAAYCIEYGLREGEAFAERAATPVLGELMRFVYRMDTRDPEQRKAFDAMQKQIRDRMDFKPKGARA